MLHDQRLARFHHLFSWTSVGLSKCPIDKMIASQGHLTVWRAPWVPSVLAKNSITEFFAQMNKILKLGFKKSIHCRLSKISLHSLTASWLEARQSFINCSVEIQLDHRNVRSTKWPVCKDIWQSEHFPERKMTSFRGNPDPRTFLSR